MKLALIGRTGWLYNTAAALTAAGHTIAAVITAPAAPEYNRTEDDFAALAASIGADYTCTTALADTEVRAISQGLDYGISVNWPTLIDQTAIAYFQFGILNAHLGDLPRYRGNACPNWAILQGENEVCLSIHFMQPDILDAGRIVVQKRHSLDTTTTIGDIYAWCDTAIPQAFQEALGTLEQAPDFCLKTADPTSVDALRCYPRTPADGFIDWRCPAEQIQRLVNASGAPFAGAYTYQATGARLRKLIVWKSRLVETASPDLAVEGHILKNDPVTGESWVRCGTGIIALQRCRYADETEDFAPGRRWRSIRMRLGISPADLLWQLQDNLAKP